MDKEEAELLISGFSNMVRRISGVDSDIDGDLDEGLEKEEIEEDSGAEISDQWIDITDEVNRITDQRLGDLQSTIRNRGHGEMRRVPFTRAMEAARRTKNPMLPYVAAKLGYIRVFQNGSRRKYVLTEDHQ